MFTICLFLDICVIIYLSKMLIGRRIFNESFHPQKLSSCTSFIHTYRLLYSLGTLLIIEIPARCSTRLQKKNNPAVVRSIAASFIKIISPLLRHLSFPSSQNTYLNLEDGNKLDINYLHDVVEAFPKRHLKQRRRVVK